MPEIPYYELPELHDVYLEESYVRAIDERADRLRLELDLALAREHRLWTAPQQNERHCYRRAVLEFDGLSRLEWRRRQIAPLTDNTGEVDFGTIDELTSDGDRQYHIAGEWGDIELHADRVTLVL